MADKYVKLNDVMEAIGGVPKKKDSLYPTPIHLAAERIIKKLKERIAKVPTADVVEVKHGRFVKNERNIPKMREFHEKGIALGMNEKSIFYTCSECGSWGSLIQKYCGNCGAKMDGADADKLKVTCLNCKHLMFSDCYGECNKQLRIVNPNDTCKYAEPKERGAE